MSAIEKELIYGDSVLSLGEDRLGLLAHLAYVAALANSHVTASDGTLRFGEGVLRLQLLPGRDVTADESRQIIERLERQGLLVQYSSDARPFAFLPQWWRFNVRQDRATRAAKNPVVPDDLLAAYPEFARKYRELPGPDRRKLPKPGRAGKNRERPAVAGNSPAPDPDPDPAADTASESEIEIKAPESRPGSGTNVTAMSLIRDFERAHRQTFGSDYVGIGTDQRELNALFDKTERDQLPDLQRELIRFASADRGSKIAAFCHKWGGARHAW